MPGSSTSVEIRGRELKLSNLDKVLYPQTGFTKGEVIDYYARIAPALLPHVRNRPVTLVRYPDGVGKGHFYEKNCPTHRPEWMPTASVPRTRGKGDIEYCLLNDEAAIVWAANLAALELHPFLHTADDLDRPTHVVFDLDPGPERTLKHCAKAALAVRDLLAELNLECWAKASGGKGIHLAAPLNTPVTYDRAKSFAQALAELMVQREPDTYTANMSKAKRGGRIFIDWSQNSQHKTTAGVYSLRARDEPRVSIPLRWDEVERLSRSRKKEPLDLSPAEALRRVERLGDLWADVLTRKQRLPDLST